MDQRLFARLDQLQRGARETQPRRQEYGRHHTMNFEHDDHDHQPAHYGEEDVHGDENMVPLSVNGTKVSRR